VQAAKTRTQEILAARVRGEMSAPVETGDARAILDALRPGDWAGIMVYGDVSVAVETAVAALRAAVQRRWRAATTFGVGPRFLHSTGQLHKGGANRGVFVQMVLEEDPLPIPGRPWGFRELMEAQADGDLAALRELGRRVARITPGDDPAATLRRLADAIRS
jgi:glucose-6-phosphate isomerase